MGTTAARLPPRPRFSPFPNDCFLVCLSAFKMYLITYFSPPGLAAAHAGVL